jgi:hypothetical protein
MDLEGEDRAQYHNRPRVTLMGLREFLVPWVLTHDHDEEQTEDEVAKDLEHQRDRCPVEDQRQDAVRRG